MLTHRHRVIHITISRITQTYTCFEISTKYECVCHRVCLFVCVCVCVCVCVQADMSSRQTVNVEIAKALEDTRKQKEELQLQVRTSHSGGAVVQR